MSQKTQNLLAQFHRVHISERDFKEAEDYLSILNKRRHQSVQRALLTSAIIAYSRPFTDNEKQPQKKAVPQLPINLTRELNAEEATLHQLILNLRNEAIAHSGFDRRPTSRGMATKTGFLVASRPFDVLSQPIDLKAFRALSGKMAHYCNQKLFDLNHYLGPTDDAP